MKVVFSAHGMYLSPEDNHDLEYLSETLTEIAVSDINLELNSGPPCGRISEERAEQKILFNYKEYLRQKAWELRHK